MEYYKCVNGFWKNKGFVNKLELVLRNVIVVLVGGGIRDVLVRFSFMFMN